jgi:2-keto-3-deoxy-L-rhamnonate aldolase RhmA
MRPNSIRRLLADNAPTLGTHLLLASPTVVEIVGHTGVFDYVEFLGEYAPYDLAILEDLCRAAELHDLGTMIKVDSENHRFVAQRAVGAGFESVLFADSRSPEDVADCVRCLKPDTPSDGGLFGVGVRRHALPAYGGTAEYVEALRDVVVAVMIEKQPAVERLDELLAVPGIDMVQWGPADYAMSIDRAGARDDEDIRATERRVIASCLSAGIRPRAEISSVEQAKYYADLGVRDFALGYDLLIIHDVLKAGGEQLRATILDET